jgi:starvation-inducible outer membrane lipoprotein
VLVKRKVNHVLETFLDPEHFAEHRPVFLGGLEPSETGKQGICIEGLDATAVARW